MAVPSVGKEELLVPKATWAVPPASTQDSGGHFFLSYSPACFPFFSCLPPLLLHSSFFNILDSLLMQMILQQGTKRETFTVALNLSLLISDGREHTETGLLSFFGSAEAEREAKDVVSDPKQS